MENNNKIEEYRINGKNYRIDVFETASNENDYYLLGYLLGDGGLNKATHKRKARLFVTSTEKYIIEFFRDRYQPDSKINSKIPVNRTRNIVSKIESHRFTFSSKFEKTFKKYGLLSLKETRTFHNVKKEYFESFLLGLFDADGFFSWGRRKDRDRLWCTFGIVHPSFKMLTKLQKVLLERYGIPTSINIKSDERCYVLRTSSRFVCEELLEILYSKKPLVYNINKKQNCDNFLREQKLDVYDVDRSKRQSGRILSDNTNKIHF